MSPMMITIAVAAAAAAAVSAMPLDTVFGGGECRAESLGCHADSTGAIVDECCVANNGYLVYAQNWTAGLMQKQANLAFINTSVVAKLPRDEWTVHGLWPDNCDGSYNTSNLGCDPSRVYEDVESRLTAVLDNHELFSLRKFWQGANGDYNWFWSHEWTKHATCFSPLKPECFGSSYVKDVSDLKAFFLRGLQLRKRFNLFNIFRSAGILPSYTKTYTRDQFNYAISNVTGFPGGIQCVVNATTGAYFVSEVWIYLFSAPDLTFVPASPTFGPKANFQSCPAGVPLHYAPNPFHHRTLAEDQAVDDAVADL